MTARLDPRAIAASVRASGVVVASFFFRYALPGSMYGPLSDGRWLHVSGINLKSETEALFARDMQSGEEREIIRRDARETFGIPAQGAAAVKHGRNVGGASAINPNGRQAAFATGQHRIEVWAMENVLSGGSAASG